MTRLCVSIFVHDVQQARREIALAAEAGADLVELRLDELEDADRVPDLVAESPIGIVLTCRSASEGGHSELSDEQRLRLVSQIAPGDDRVLIDFEHRALQRIGPADIHNRLIVSFHDFSGRPPTLTRTYAEMAAGPGHIVKLAWMARSIRDNIEALEILQSRQKPTIALCMGEAGLISRVLAKKFGGFLTFAALEKGAESAPGQITIHEMKRLYRWDRIGPQTRVYGVVACPVAHSMSPAVHNAAFDAAGHDGVYLPMLVQPGYESFKAFMEDFANYKPLHLRGLSITIPHKENALRYLQEKGARIDPLAVDIGAVNTIIIDRDAAENPILSGINTDYQAIIDTICNAMQITPQQLRDCRVAVIGAGGTGRTAVAALAKLGATVVVYNRTYERAEELARAFDGRIGKVVAARLEKLCDSCCQVYINTTSVGMYPSTDQSVFANAPPRLDPQTLVFDTVYNPPKTKLLRQAEAAGAKTVGGIEMFVRQAAGQFLAWTGLSPPMQLMRQIIQQRLSS